MRNIGRALIAVALAATALPTHAGARDLGVLAPPVDLRRLEPGDVFRECADCPRMVVIAAGDFTMGSPEDERWRHALREAQTTVHVPRFAIAETEITVGEWRRYLAETGAASPRSCARMDAEGEIARDVSALDPGYAQTDDHPVVCVGWREALDYVAWLNEKVGAELYRLPTAEEFEFVLRAGSTTAFPWGDDVDDACAYDNVSDLSRYRFFASQARGRRPPLRWFAQCDDGFAAPSPVRAFPPNAFGLYGTVGNAGEWFGECGSALCVSRKARVGSYASRSWHLRSAARLDHPTPRRGAAAYRDGRWNFLGFRVVRDVPARLGRPRPTDASDREARAAAAGAGRVRVLHREAVADELALEVDHRAREEGQRHGVDHHRDAVLRQHDVVLGGLGVELELVLEPGAAAAEHRDAQMRAGGVLGLDDLGEPLESGVGHFRPGVLAGKASVSAHRIPLEPALGY